MIEAAIGVELSRSIFSNGKQHVTAKGKENDGGKTDKQQATKRTAKDHAPVGVTHDTHYTMAEVCAKFDYSYGRLYTLRMRYQISAVHAFGTTCYPKDAIDKAIAEERERLGKTLGEHWYTCGELMRIYGLGKTQVRRFANTHNVRTKKANGNRLYYLKDELMKWITDGGCSDTHYPDDAAANIDERKAERHLKVLQAEVKRKPKPLMS